MNINIIYTDSHFVKKVFFYFLFVVVAFQCTNENITNVPNNSSIFVAAAESITVNDPTMNNESLYSNAISDDTTFEILESNINNSKTCFLDSFNTIEHHYKYPEDVDFDFIHANKAYKIVLNKLLKHKLILKNVDNRLEIDSYDIIQHAFNFRQTVPSLDPNVGRVIAGWWSYHTKTGKVFNDILFEELK